MCSDAPGISLTAADRITLVKEPVQCLSMTIAIIQSMLYTFTATFVGTCSKQQTFHVMYVSSKCKLLKTTSNDYHPLPLFLL